MKTTDELMSVLKKDPSPDFARMEDLTFSEYIQSLMEARNLTRAQLLSRTSLDRVYGYQILSGKRIPAKRKVIQLALAMELNLEQTNHLLSLSGNGALYPRIREDAIYISAILHHKSVVECSIDLTEAGFPPLG